MKTIISKRLLGRRFRQLAGAAAALHLALAFCAPAKVQLPFEGASRFWYGLAVYANATGADNSFGFYAPSVGSDHKVECLAFVPATESWVEVELPEVNRETSLRFDTLTGQATKEGKHDEIMNASWAAYVFGQLPGAEVVLVEHHVELIPTMEQFRKTGARPAWLPYDIATFARSSGQIPMPGEDPEIDSEFEPESLQAASHQR
jgi:hypothetical protein